MLKSLTAREYRRAKNFYKRYHRYLGDYNSWSIIRRNGEDGN
jgi:hypothetical protein